MGIQPSSISKDHPSQREGTVVGKEVYVRLPEMAISFARGLVIQAWVRPDVSQKAPIVWLGGDGAKIALWLLSDGLSLEWIDNQGIPRVAFAKAALPIGAWSRVAVALGPGGVTFFVGATPIAVPGSVPLPREAARDGNAIGAQANLGKGFAGAIGEVRLWNRSSGLDVILDRGARDLRGDEPGLVGWWTLEGAGGVSDRSPFGRHGVLVGGAFKAGASSFTVEPTLDRCLDFGAGLGVVDLVIPKLRRPFTWQALVRVRDLAREATLLDATRENLGLRVTLHKGVLKASVVDKTGTLQCSSSALVAANTWTSVALRVGDDGALTLFVNDAIVGAVAVPNRFDVRLPRLGPGLDGAMAEVRFWSRALSSAEIADTSRRRIHAWAPGLVGCWRMDDEVLQRQDAPANYAITVFPDRDFQGKAAVLPPGRYNVNQLGIGNDVLSSIMVPPYLGLQVTVYKDSNFTGKSTTYTRDTALVADNDTASSIVVEGRRGLVDAGLAGSCVTYVTDAQPAARTGLALASAPLVVPPRVAGLGGALTLPDLPVIGTGGYSVQMWVNLDEAIKDQPVLTLSGADAITVFQHNDFGGASQALGVGKHDTSRLTIGDNQISSIKVPRGLRAVLYDQSGFQGGKLSFETDAASLRDANDRTSSITVESLPVVAISAKKAGEGLALTLGSLDLGVLLTPRRWTHVSITHSADGLLCVYADGRLVRRVDLPAVSSGTFTPVVGPYGGSVAELRLWSRPLSSDEVDGNWQRRVSAGASLVGRWALAGDLSGGPSAAKGTVTWREAPGLAFKSPSATAQASVRARASFLADQTGGTQGPQLCVNLTALDAAGRPLPRARLTVGSSSSVPLYRNTVRAENRITNTLRFELVTDARGVARLALQPSELSAPILKVRHDGMSEGEWALVTPDQVLHEALASLTVAEVQKGRRASATSKGGTAGLCTDGAENLVTLLRGMLGAAATFSFEAESTAGLAFGDLDGEPAPVLLTPVTDGAQAQIVPVADDVVLVRRLGRPIAAAGPAEDDEGAVSFGLVEDILSISTKIWEEVTDAADAVATKVVDLGIETFESISNRIPAPIVESLTFAVNTVISGIKVAANWVVKTVEDVASAVVDLFKKIGKTLGDVLGYLAELFGWDDILETADLLLDDLKGSIAAVKGGVGSVFERLKGAVTLIEGSVIAALDGKVTLRGDSREAKEQVTEAAPPESPGPLDFLLSLLPDDLEATINGFRKVFDPVSGVLTGAVGRVTDLARDLGAAWKKEWDGPDFQKVRADPLALFDSDPSEWKAALRCLVLLVTGSTRAFVDFVGDLAVAVLDSFVRLLDLPLKIPYLTDFVEKYVLGGRELTVGILLCLIPAIPLTALYKALTLGSGGPAALASPVSFDVADTKKSWTESPWKDVVTRSIDLVNTLFCGMLDAVETVSETAVKPFEWPKWILGGTILTIQGAGVVLDAKDLKVWSAPNAENIANFTKFVLDVGSWGAGFVGWIAAALDLNDVPGAGEVDDICGVLGDGLGVYAGILDIPLAVVDDERSKLEVAIAPLDLVSSIAAFVGSVAGAIPDPDLNPDPVSKAAIKATKEAGILGAAAVAAHSQPAALGLALINAVV